MLISPEYRKLQNDLHERDADYGMMAQFYGETISEMVKVLGVTEVLDYGCGHNRSLMKTFKPEGECRVQCYDPGVPEYADLPDPSQMVVCIDCLEHIEPEYIEDVLDHLEELTGEVLFATVHTGPAKRTLADGRNAHLIQKPQEWWVPKFMERFTMKGFNQRNEYGFEIVCLAKGSNLKKKWGVDSSKSGFESF